MNCDNRRGSYPVPLNHLDGVLWHEHGQASFSGQALRLFQLIDQLFQRWSYVWAAQPYLFSTTISAKELNKIGYFGSFPHLVTFAASASDQCQKQLAKADCLKDDGCLSVTGFNPVSEVLTPAACYHFYINLEGTQFDSASYYTTVAKCFRRENEYKPLERQSAFSMREIVCIGSAQEVTTFLERFQLLLSRFFTAHGLPVTFEQATDPFFDPKTSPKYLMQKLQPLKTEMIFDGKLAIGSLNFHRNFFGEAYGLERNGKAAYTGCVAFGLERWMYALMSPYGDQFRREIWSQPADAA
jgi:seryl-tRNA synthetase